MKIVIGDLIQMALDGEFDVIIHGCNCFNTMGKGIAKSIREYFPEAYIEDCKTQKGDKNKLGTISYAHCRISPHPTMIDDRLIIVVNAYTQYNYYNKYDHGDPDKIKYTFADYTAIRGCFKEIKNKFSGLRIGYPKIGAGLAGGNWETISKIIDEELKDENHTLVQFKEL